MMNAQVWKVLEETGVILLSDKKLPSVATIVAGEPVRGSWWAHPRAHPIFHAATALGDHPDVLVTKLLHGKVTFVHRKLWPAVLGVAASRAAWQTRGLSAAARALLAQVNRKGSIQCEQKMTSDVRELEKRLLLHAEEVHTERGSHANILESWKHWAGRAGFTGPAMPAAEAQRQLESLAGSLGAKLPWDS